MKRKIEQQPKLKLYYFDLKGKGEPIRLICAYAGLELEDHRFISRDEFLAMKEGTRLPFGQVPMLEVDGKHNLVQTSAIMRYLGKLSGLYPQDDPILAAKVDAAMDQETDAFTGVTVLTYGLRFGIDLTDEATEKSYEHINQDVLPAHLRNVEKCFAASSTGWIAATEDPSPADFMWFATLTSLVDKKGVSDKIKSLEDFPHTKAFLAKFASLEAIQEFYGKDEQDE
jgi:prostaglandin-H2 D-isomerase / glutathione transferase